MPDSPPTTLDAFCDADSCAISYPQLIRLGSVVVLPRCLVQMGGGFAGGRVGVKVANGKHIKLVAVHSDLIPSHNITVIRKGLTGHFLELEYIRLSPGRPPGLGAVMLLRMAQAACSLGFSRLVLLAAGGSGATRPAPWQSGFCGYYAWPRMGFDSALHPHIVSLVAGTHLDGCSTVSHIMERDPDWWKNNGDGCRMEFSLQSGSKSWQTLFGYLRSKGLTL